MSRHVFGILFFILGIGLISCIEGTGDKITYRRYGVAMLQPQFCFYTTDGEEGNLVTPSSLIENEENIKEGDCFDLSFRANFSGLADNQVYDVEMLDMVPVDALELEATNSLLPDTLATDREQFFTFTLPRAQLIKGRLFLQLELKERREEQREDFIFQYNPDSITVVDGRRVYNLYLRALREEASDSLYGKWIQTEALVLDQFIKDAGAVEQAEGLDSLHIRLNYPNRFSTDSIYIRWTAAGLYSIKL